MAEITPIRTAAEVALVERFEDLKDKLPGSGEIARGRDEAFALIAAAGLPNRRVEEWKYTDLRNAVREAAPLAERPADAAALVDKGRAFAKADAVRLSFANGHLVAERSDLAALPAGVTVTPLAAALAEGHPLLAEMGKVAVAKGNFALALNSAFMMDGALIKVAAGTAVDKALHLRFVNGGASPFATAPRIVILVEDGASVTVHESHEGVGTAAYQANSVVEIVAGNGTTITHARLNAEQADAIALSTLAVTLGAEAKLTSLGAVTGGSLSRHQVFLAFAGEHSSLTLGGATMLRGRQHADTTLVVDHAVPHCDSRELFKTVIDGEATGVFQGKIIVRPDAQKTDGRMMSAALLLSETATMNNKPELEIFADDVQCAHGATCGELDDDLLFYLTARGLPRAVAEALLVQAFLGEALELVEDEAVREELVARAEGWLGERT